MALNNHMMLFNFIQVIINQKSSRNRRKNEAYTYIQLSLFIVRFIADFFSSHNVQLLTYLQSIYNQSGEVNDFVLFLMKNTIFYYKSA